MTTGIYRVDFDSGDFYVGQSQNIEKRKQYHLYYKGEGSPKLEKAFEKQATPTFTIIEETTDLNAREVYWIEQLKPTLNTLSGGTVMRGLNHPRSMYTKQEIESVVEQYCNTAKTYQEISESTGVGISTCHDILKKRSHFWATEGLDLSQYERVQKYRVYSPDGEVYESTSLGALASATGLSASAVNSLVRNKRGYLDSGWSIYPPQNIILQYETEPEIHTTVLKARYGVLAHLPTYSKNKLLKDFKPSVGWKIILCS